jgi:MFS family permease
MFWSPVVPSIVNQLAPDHLRGRYNAASSNAWQIALVMGPTMAGTLLGAGLHWLWIALLVTGLFVVTVLALRLKLPSRVVDPATPVNP